MAAVNAAAVINRALQNKKAAAAAAAAPAKTSDEKRYTLEEAWPIFKRAFEKLAAEKTASAVDEVAVSKAYELITGDKA